VIHFVQGVQKRITQQSTRLKSGAKTQHCKKKIEKEKATP